MIRVFNVYNIEFFRDHRLRDHFVMPNSTKSTFSLYCPSSTMGTLQLVGREKKSYCFRFNSQIIIYVIICWPTRTIISMSVMPMGFLFALWEYRGHYSDRPSKFILPCCGNVVDFDSDEKLRCLFILFYISPRIV